MYLKITGDKGVTSWYKVDESVRFYIPGSNGYDDRIPKTEEYVTVRMVICFREEGFLAIDNGQSVYLVSDKGFVLEQI